MPERRVVITGIGPVTPIGTGLPGLWDGLQAARSVVRRVTRFDPAPFKSHLAAEVDGFDPQAWMEPRRAKRLDRCSQFTLAAARLALDDAGLDLSRENPDQVGAMMGSALGGVEFAEREHEKYLAGGVRADYGHQTPGPEKRQGVSDPGQLCHRGWRDLLRGRFRLDLRLVP